MRRSYAESYTESSIPKAFSGTDASAAPLIPETVPETACPIPQMCFFMKETPHRILYGRAYCVHCATLS